MKESPWTRALCEEIKKHDGLVIPLVASMMGAPGIPDRFIAHALWIGHIEFKGVKTKLKDLQGWYIRELQRRQPGSAYVVRQPDRIEDSRGVLLANFDGTGIGLLRSLHNLAVEARKT